MPQVTALRAFSFAPDGMRTRWVEAGEVLDVPASLLADLISIGNVERSDLLIPPGPDVRRKRNVRAEDD